MRPINNYENVQATSGEFARPDADGYICVITKATDIPFDLNTNKGDYLNIEYDFVVGQFAGFHKENFDKWGYWGGKFVRSYKEKALGMFKHFTNCVEQSNNGYKWDWNEQGLVGKFVGLVLGKEEYKKNDGTIGTRLYVHSVKTVEEIKNGEFKVPALKKLSEDQKPYSSAPKYEEIADDDDLPFN